MHLGLGFPLGGAGFAAPPAFVPSDLSGLILDLDADFTTDGGDGTACTVLADRSATAGDWVEGTAGQGPLRRDPSGRRGRKVVEYQNNRYAKSQNATHVALFNGAVKDFTIFDLVQFTTNGLSYVTAAGSTTVSRHTGWRRPSTTYRNQAIHRDPTNNLTAGVDLTLAENFSPQLHVHRASGNTWDYRLDGVNYTPVTVTRAAQTAIDILTEGALYQATAAAFGTFYRRRKLIYNRRLSDLECQQVETYLADQMGVVGIGNKWKAGYSTAASFGNGSNSTLVIGILGQSNDAGRGTGSYVSIYAGTSQAAYVLYQDGNLAEAADPTADPAGVVSGGSADSGSAVGYAIRMIDRLRELGETRNIIVVNCAVGGTSSTSWVSSLTANPPIVNSLVGQVKHRISEALKAPNSKLMIVYGQGESNTSGSPTVAAWTTDTGALFDELNTYFAGKFDKSEHFVLVKLHATAWTLSTSTNWADLRTAQAALATARADTVIVDAHDGPFLLSDNLHRDKGSNTAAAETGQMKTGINVANGIWAAAA